MTLVQSFIILVGLTTVAVLATANTQARFNFFDHPNVEGSPVESTSNFTTMSLSSIGSEFTTLTHPDFPFHSLRIKKAPKEWCDPSVNKYTGYIDITPARHIWFYFFESRSNPAEDDVVLWTNGGPGGSSSMGLFMELGPCQIDGNSTKVNPYSWNELSNIFFIDQPIGVELSCLHCNHARLSSYFATGTGFSYADFGETVNTTEAGAVDIAIFSAMFFDIFDSFKGRAYHLAGESYAVSHSHCSITPYYIRA